MNNPEHLPQSSERSGEALAGAAAERSAELLRSPERSVEASPEQHTEALERARHDVAETAVSQEKPGHEASPQASQSHHVRPASGKKAREKAYKDILRHTQNELTPASRAFSKVIHNPTVEKVSNAAGSSVARPNAILFGALFAFVISGAVYLIARYYGYSLSGFEAIGSFCIGWIVGVVIDILRLAARKH